VHTGTHVVLCSSFLAHAGTRDEPPAPAFYLDPAWKAVAGSDATFVAWPDFGVIDVDALRLLVDAIREQLDAGPVEIGCLGGHGRTGTLLAAVIADVEGLGAAAAIRAARERYCAHAVETPAQERLLHEFAGDPPPDALQPP
jgi:protein-tyrosine phosphatase